jgi:hypothetical protein
MERMVQLRCGDWRSASGIYAVKLLAAPPAQISVRELEIHNQGFTKVKSHARTKVILKVN